VGSTDDRYATDIHWVGGCLSKDNFDWSATMLAHQDLPPDPAIVGGRWRAMWEQRREANRPWILTWLSHQRRDAYWRQGSVCEDFSRIQVPVYAVSGWADNYSEAVPRLLAGLSVPRLGLVGPWAHSYPYDAAVGPSIGWLQEVVRWCDHWMRGRDTGMLDGPMYRVWMQEAVPPATCYAERPGRWVAEHEWPSPRIEARSLPLAADGRLGGEAAGGRAVCSPLWVGLAAGEVGRYGGDAEWPTDQREDDGGSLVWLSEPLAERLEILGAPLVRLRFSSDRPQALVAARLNEVWPDGRSTRVGIGLLNLTHRDGHEHATALEPGRACEAVVEMDDIAHAFAPGNRIAVALSTTYWPIAWPSPALATLTVDCPASALVLPVRPPRAEDDALEPFGPAQEAQDTPVVWHPVERSHPRRVTRDLLSGRMVVDFPRWTARKEMPDIAQTHATEGFARYAITDGDPLSATCETGYRVEIARPDATIRHESRGRLTCDATHFRVEAEVVLSEDGREVFRRAWDERIPRDMV
jgi:predicted acyl esterase